MKRSRGAATSCRQAGCTGTSPLLQRIDPSAWGRALVPRRRHLAYISVWAVAFVAMSASGYWAKHPGQYVPFWQKACAADARSACEDLYFLQDGYCEDGSGWACNELAILLTERYDNRRRAALEFERACGLGFSAGCDNASAITQGNMFRRDAPTVADYRCILRGSKGPFPDREPAQLYARAACRVFLAPAGPSKHASRGARAIAARRTRCTRPATPVRRRPDLDGRRLLRVGRPARRRSGGPPGAGPAARPRRRY